MPMQIPFSRPHLRVAQHRSAFAEGNARWTNQDLDPISRANRKWGVASLIGKFKAHHQLTLLHSSNIAVEQLTDVIPSLLDL